MEKRAKYNAKPVDQDGYHFDSQAEARRFRELALMQEAGEIWNLEIHVRYPILDAFIRDGKVERGAYFEADFVYFDRESKCTIVEEIKGFKTQLYILKRKMFLSKYPHLKFIEIMV